MAYERLFIYTSVYPVVPGRHPNMKQHTVSSTVEHASLCEYDHVFTIHRYHCYPKQQTVGYQEQAETKLHDTMLTRNAPAHDFGSFCTRSIPNLKSPTTPVRSEYRYTLYASLQSNPRRKKR
jgi:hypothetical protein